MAKNGAIKESPKSQGKITDFWKAKTPNKRPTDPETVESSPQKILKSEKSPAKMPGKTASPVAKKVEKPSKEQAKSKIPKMDDGSSKFSVGSVRAVLNRANPEMNIGNLVPSCVSAAATQFAIYMAQTALENSMKRTGKDGDSAIIDYEDVAIGVNGDPRLEVIHGNIPYQLTAVEALKRREEFLKTQDKR